MSSKPDVIIVGGGVFGCATAYELAKRSADVMLIDRQLPGRATSASAGGLWPLGESVGLGCGVIFQATVTGEDGNDDAHPHVLPTVFREFLSESNARFPELANELLDASGVDIEFQDSPGLLFTIYNDKDRRFVDHVAELLDAPDALQVLSPREAQEVEPEVTDELQGAALLPGEHQVNPMLLAEAYKRAAINLGARLVPQNRVTRLRRDRDRIVGVESPDGFHAAGTVINAAGAWSGQLAASASLQIPVFPVRGQVVLTQTVNRLLRCCLSTSDCYLAQKSHGEVLIGSTTEHVGFDVSVTAQAVRELSAGAIRAIPSLRNVQVKRVWAGLRPGTPDELPVLGEMDGVRGYLNATGGFRTGIVASPLAAIVVAQACVGEPTSVSIEPFLARRFTADAYSLADSRHAE